MKRKLVAILLTLVLFGGALATQIRVQQLRSKEFPRDWIYLVPNLSSLKVISLGYQGLMADMLWLRAIQYFGGWYSQMKKQPKGFLHLMDAITYLDPKFLGAYTFGAFGIQEGLGDFDAAVDLLQRGAKANKENPEAWRLLFEAAFIRFYNQQQNDAAKALLEEAAEMPNADPLVSRSIAYIDSVSGRRDLARTKYQQLYEQATNDAIKQIALSHLIRLGREEHLEMLNKVIEVFKTQEGRLPISLDELVQKRLISGIPKDPGSSRYIYVPQSGKLILEELLQNTRSRITETIIGAVTAFEGTEKRKPANLQELRNKGLVASDCVDPASAEIILDASGTPHFEPASVP